MRELTATVSNLTDAAEVIDELVRRLPEATKNSMEFQSMFPQVIDCIKDFSERAKQIARAGTTVHVEREFILPDAHIRVALVYPEKKTFAQRLAGLFR